LHTKDYHSSNPYVWNPKLSGGKWADWNNTNSPLIWDATPHHYSGKVNVLFGDCHVEEMTPDRLKELTR
jgi:prepilin-type processing-associated H-X9-DG protein